MKKILLLLAAVISFTVSYAQDIKDIKIDLSLKDETIINCFKEIERQTSFSFIYNSRVEKIGSKINIAAEDISVSDALKLMSGQSNLTFKQVGENITVTIDGDDTKKVIKGTIIDAKTGSSLVGVIIRVKDGVGGTVTNNDGFFSMSVPATAKELTLSYVGYQSRVVDIPLDGELMVQMVEDTNSLDEVVVIGYGTQNKSKVTGSISKLDFNDVSEYPVPIFDQAMAGKLPGVEVIQPTGDPGSNALFRIRGVKSLSAGNQPLIVLDGVPLSYGTNMANINPDDIASVEVLKDAASAAIYGSRGTNGVVIITTKSGDKKDGVTYNFHANYGVQDVPRRIDLMDAYEFADARAEAIKNDWIRSNPDKEVPEDPGEYGIPDYMIPYLEGKQGLTNTDWQDEIFRKAAMQEYGLSVAGNNGKTSFFLSGNFLKQDGVMMSSDFKRYSFRSNIKTKLSDKLTLGVNLNPSYGVKNKLPDENYNDDGLILSAICSYPFFKPYKDNGDLAISEQINETILTGGAQVENPVAMAELIHDKTEDIRLIGGTYLSYQPIKGLVLKTFFGTDLLSTRENYFRPSILGRYTVAAPTQATGKFWSKRIYNWTSENSITYSRSINNHSFSVLAAFTSQKENTERVYLEGTDYPNDKVQTINAAATTNGNTTETEWVLLSYLARVTYDYKNRYLVNLTYRTDGSSRFGKNNKWGSFPSASVGWRPTAEPFYPQNKVLTDMKFRASWGRTGNFFIDDYASIARLGQQNYVFNNNVSNGLGPVTAPNDNLTWENTTMRNFGVDIQLFNNRIEIIGDYYNSITSDMLLEVPVPYYSGYSSSIQNIGKVENKGYEITLNTNNRIGGFDLQAGVNFYTNRNKVLALGPDQEVIRGTWLFSTEVGQPIGSFWGYNSLGVISSQEQIDNYATVKGAQVGRTYLWEDTDGDGEITEDDKKILGNYFPDYNLNFNAALSFKGITLSFVIQSVQGHEVFNYLKLWSVNQTHWSPPLKETADRETYVYPDLQRTDNNYQRGSMLVEDASFVRLRNVTLGYNLPPKLLSKLNITNLRVYLSGQNIYTWTKYGGYNPEVSSRPDNPLTPGIDYGNYPVPRVYSLGLNMSF